MEPEDFESNDELVREDEPDMDAIMEENEELDREYIANQIGLGFTSGVLDNPQGYRISWELKLTKTVR